MEILELKKYNGIENLLEFNGRHKQAEERINKFDNKSFKKIEYE